MAHRIQVLFADDQYTFLDEEADRSSVSIAELVRRAVDTTYGLTGSRKVIEIHHSIGRRPGRRIG